MRYQSSTTRYFTSGKAYKEHKSASLEKFLKTFTQNYSKYFEHKSTQDISGIN